MALWMASNSAMPRPVKRFGKPRKVVVNATGPFSDNLRRLADPAVQPIITPSQGIHLVFDGSFLPRDNAIMVPHTSDGRVMFALPWHGHTLVGTTDTAVPEATLEPVAMAQEIDFLLQTAGRYLAKSPAREDVLSVFAGIRPLVRSSDAGNTAALSRDHTITHRGIRHGHALRREMDHLPAHGGGLREPGRHAGAATGQAVCDREPAHPLFGDWRGMGGVLHDALPYTESEVVDAVRNEMARTVEDVLARRTRALFLRARAAIEMAPAVAAIMARELGRDREWEASAGAGVS